MNLDNKQIDFASYNAVVIINIFEQNVQMNGQPNFLSFTVVI